MKLQGKNIILTGASRGFGKYLASRLWDEGANLLLTAKHSFFFFVNDRHDQTCRILECDLTGWNAGMSIARCASEIWDHIDGLVNNAAIQGPVGKAWEVDLIELNRTIAIDLFAPIDLCRLVVPEMLKVGRGKIINISGGGAANARPNYSAYATAKAGLVRFSECLAEELKGTGIDVNCVAPGKMPTDMLPSGETSDPDAMQKAADLVIFLLSEESNALTGRLISAIWDDWRSFLRRGLFADDYTLRRIVPKL